MATTYKVLGQVSPAANTANTVYTVPAATSTVVSTIMICNLDNTARTYNLAVVPSGQSLAQKNYIAFAAPIPATDSIGLTIGITLAANDSISVYSNSTINLAFSVFGSEIS